MEDTVLQTAWQALFDEWLTRPAPLLKHHSWRQLISTLCNAPSVEAAAYHFRNRGFSIVADLLRDENLRAAVEHRRERLTASGWEMATPWSSAYPSRLAERLGRNAPPILWIRGYNCDARVPAIAIVGSRSLTTDERGFALAVGAECARLGYQVFSGGAIGADTLGLRGAGIGLHFLPGSGTSRHRNLPVACRDPEGPVFDRIEALTRNRWVYAASQAAVVVASRLNRGGSWHSAIGALRARLCPVFAYLSQPPSTGNAALIGNGARALRNASDLQALLTEVFAAEAPLPFQNE